MYVSLFLKTFRLFLVTYSKSYLPVYRVNEFCSARQSLSNLSIQISQMFLTFCQVCRPVACVYMPSFSKLKVRDFWSPVYSMRISKEQLPVSFLGHCLLQLTSIFSLSIYNMRIEGNIQTLSFVRTAFSHVRVRWNSFTWVFCSMQKHSSVLQIAGSQMRLNTVEPQLNKPLYNEVLGINKQKPPFGAKIWSDI